MTKEIHHRGSEAVKGKQAYVVLALSMVLALGACSKDSITEPPDTNPPPGPDVYERTATFTSPAFLGSDCQPGNTIPISLSQVEVWVQDVSTSPDYRLTQTEPVSSTGGTQESITVTLPRDRIVNVRFRLVTPEGVYGCWSEPLSSGA